MVCENLLAQVEKRFATHLERMIWKEKKERRKKQREMRV